MRPIAAQRVVNRKRNGTDLPAQACLGILEAFTITGMPQLCRKESWALGTATLPLPLLGVLRPIPFGVGVICESFFISTFFSRPR